MIQTKELIKKQKKFFKKKKKLKNNYIIKIKIFIKVIF